MTIAIRASQLDAYDWMKSYDAWTFSDKTLAELDARTTEEWVAEFLGGEENERMRIGTAFHSMMEDWVQGKSVKDPFADNITISRIADDLERPFAFRWLCAPRLVLQGAMTEVPMATYIPAADAALTGHIDARVQISRDTRPRGRVVDYKTTSKPVNMERYFRAWQWRAYLFLSRDDQFTYHFFRITPTNITKKIRNESWYQSRLAYIDVREHRHLDLTRYAELNQEVVRCVTEVAEWARQTGALVDRPKDEIEAEWREANPAKEY